MMIGLIVNLIFFTVVSADLSISYESMPLLQPTRRILKGNQVGNTRPYMVYLRAGPNAEPKIRESNWLCGGVIIHKRYILTSAACVEDATHFQVVSGTHTWVPVDEYNECIDNGAKRAIWKCVPKSYFFDGNDFDNIRWMVGDIAIVKVEDDFNFEKKIRGCDFIPKKIDFNNRSLDFEKGGTVATIAGWGTTDKYYVETDYTSPIRSAANSVELLETDVVLISKKGCKSRWDERYHFIINDEMICTKDSVDPDHMDTVCKDTGVLCKGLEDSAEDDYYIDEPKNKTDLTMIIDPAEMIVHTAAHQDQSRRRFRSSGGFCENDHGGPLIVGQGRTAMVVGVMSACLTNSITNRCYGPFLFTSVYKYRNLIACAIDNNVDPSCQLLLRNPAQGSVLNQNRKEMMSYARYRPEPLTKDLSTTPSRYSTEKDINNAEGQIISETREFIKSNRKIDKTKTYDRAHVKPTPNSEYLKFNPFTEKNESRNPSVNTSEWLRNVLLKKKSIENGHKMTETFQYPEKSVTTAHPYPAIKELIMRKFLAGY